MSGGREFDVVVWGATGFTGRLVAEYLLDRYGVEDDLSWAIGGRSAERLAAVREDLGPGAAALELVVGDAARPDDMSSLAERTQVVCTTVGPYATYGSELVDACVGAGTDYCDLTGELHWMRSMIDRHVDGAAESGARIVHACGFDCIPSDLGVFFLQQQMQERHGVPSPRVRMGVAGFSGSVSGGTVASMLAMMEAGRDDPSVQEVIDDPYGLNPSGERYGPDDPDRLRAELDPVFGQWTGPFVMGPVDTKVVRRTNALLDHAYGRDFRYDECLLTGTGPVGRAKATAMAAGLGGGQAAV
ncbi:MAG: saccharopine dehydrogenase NADP-binding domain-containing protein, partial [Actinomycetota bacterium]